MVSRKHLYIQTHFLITVNLFTDIRSFQSTTGGRQNHWRRSLYFSASWCNKSAMRVWKRYIDRQRHWSSAMFLSTVRFFFRIYSKVSDTLTTLLNAFSFLRYLDNFDWQNIIFDSGLNLVMYFPFSAQKDTRCYIIRVLPKVTGSCLAQNLKEVYW